MRVGFMGSPLYSVATLNALVDAGFEVPVVYCQPPRPKGRGKILSPCPVHVQADTLGISVQNPVHFKDSHDVDMLRTYDVDVLIVVAYGIILPQSVLDIPTYGCVNGHASLLPRWRGAAPIQRAIESGDTQTGICVMQMDAGLDTGDVISTHTVDISPTMTGVDVHDMLSALTATAIVQDLHHMQLWQARPQETQGITYAHKLTKAESVIDWTQSATDIYNKVRAFTPFPSTQTRIKGNDVKIVQTQISDISHTMSTGQVVSVSPLIVACGQGTALEIIILQKQGKTPIGSQDFLNGVPLCVGDMFGV